MPPDASDTLLDTILLSRLEGGGGTLQHNVRMSQVCCFRMSSGAYQLRSNLPSMILCPSLIHCIFSMLLCVSEKLLRGMLKSNSEIRAARRGTAGVHAKSGSRR